MPSSISSASWKWTLPSSKSASSSADRPGSGSPKSAREGMGGTLPASGRLAADPSSPLVAGSAGVVEGALCDSACVWFPQPQTRSIARAIAIVAGCMIPPFPQRQRDACRPIRSVASVHQPFPDTEADREIPAFDNTTESCVYLLTTFGYRKGPADRDFRVPLSCSAANESAGSVTRVTSLRPLLRE